jgi:hypothetical protein
LPGTSITTATSVRWSRIARARRPSSQSFSSNAELWTVAFFRAARTVGIAMAAMIPTIATTTMISMSVKPLLSRIRVESSARAAPGG